jgi:hypothetical protein
VHITPAPPRDLGIWARGEADSVLEALEDPDVRW